MRRTHLLSLLGVVLALAGGWHRPAAAQEDEEGDPVLLEVDPATGALRVRLGPVLNDGGLRRALQSGLPLRVHLDVELWKDRFFDSQEGRAEWRATVVYEPLGETYRVETSADSAVRVVASLDDAGRVLRRRFELPLRPPDEGKYYYQGVLEVETLSLSDLEELQRWLRGDLGPAVSGRDPVENAVEKGMRRLVVRMLGLPARRYRIRTEVFRFGGEGATSQSVRSGRKAVPPREVTTRLATDRTGRSSNPLRMSRTVHHVPRQSRYHGCLDPTPGLRAGSHPSRTHARSGLTRPPRM